MAAPDARTDNYSVTEDQLLVGSANGFLNNDSDPDGDPLSIIRVDGLPFSFGTPITLASGAKLTINADGSFQYDQNGSFTHLSAGQTATDIFTYTISDGKLGFDTSSVCMTISGVTQNPTVIDDTPSIGTPTAALAGELTLDESAVGTDTAVAVPPVGVASVTANFADNFAAASPSYGADGPGSTSLAFELSSEGLGSGLYALDNTDTTTGAATAVLSNVGPTWHVVAAADFNGDGKSDILWQGDDGTAAMWLMDGPNATFVGAVGPFNPGPTWHIKGTGDFNGDGKSDILWQGDDGTAAMWLMDGTNATFVGAVGPFNPGPTWHIKGTGDFNGDGKSDILWQGDDGTVAMWLMDGPNATFVGAAGPFNPGPSWEIKGTGDFNGDGKSDIIWQGDDGTAAMWLMDGPNATFVGAVGPFNPGPSWEIKGTGDFNGDGKSDIIWQGDDGTAAMWLMDGTNATFVGAVGPFNPGQKIKGTGDFNGDAKADILWQNDSGLPSIWTMVGATDTDGIGQGDEILLYVSADGTTVKGSTAATEAGITAANTYFTITVDNNPASPTFGDVTFTQTQNIWHDDTNDPDDPEALTTAAAGDLTLTLTVTDADGDTDSASINLGAGVFVIQDDGPNAVVIGTPAAIVLDESPLGEDSADGVAPLGVASATGNFSLNFAMKDFGTDGASSATYALVLTASDVPSGLFALGVNGAQGASIVLNKVGNDILGQVSAVTYFKISVDGNGVVTFAQLKNIWHDDTGSNDEAATLTLSSPALLQLTVMDADGDTASAGLNLGQGVFQIQDDGPTAAIVATGASVVLDESLGVDALDPNAATDDNVAGNLFPPAFGTPIGLLSNVDLVNTTTTTGEDNEGATTVVTLAIAGGVNGTDSGLQTTDNRQISLFNESGVIVGRMDTAGGVADPAGTVAFAISINNAGEVTVAQYLSLEHPTPGASYDEAVNLGNLVNAVVTVTDGDGDVATQNIAIGNAIQFQDDGPTAAIVVTGASVVLDESLGVDALDPNAATDDNVAGNPFLPAYGTPIGLLLNVALGNVPTATGSDDEGATTTVTLSIVGGNGTDSGLLTTDNRQISLFNESGVIVGRMDTAGGVADPAGTVAFAISVNNAGEVTVAQYLSLEHPTPGASYDEAVNLGNLVNAVVTVTDGDGDVATQNIAIGNAIQFQDDGPTAAIVVTGASVVLDESLGVDALDPNAATDDNVAGNLFPPAFGTPIGLLSNVDLVNTTTTTGEDNEGATTVVTLAIAGGVNGTDSGLQTTDNRQISLFNESGVIVGRMDTAGGVADPAGTVAFAISVNNAGEVTVAQYLSLEHPTPGASYDEAVNLGNLVNAVVTVTDGDGDVATQNIAIGNAIQFQDDGPTAAIVVTGASVVLDESLGVDALDPNAATDDNVAGNLFPPAFGTPIGLLSNVDLVNTTTTTGEDNDRGNEEHCAV